MTKKMLILFIITGFLSIFIMLNGTLNVDGQVKKNLTNECQEKKSSVKITTVQPINFSGRIIYLIEYSYEFKERQTIFIRNIGELSAKGKMKHLFEEESLEFLTKSGGESLCKIKLEPNKKPSEGGADDIPAPSVFSGLKSSSTSAGNNAEFMNRLTNLLNNTNFSYRINNHDGITSVISNYRRLNGFPQNLVGELAVQITFPQQINGNQFSFYIYNQARQKPRRSDDWEDISSPQNQEVVDNFINSLIEGLK